MPQLAAARLGGLALILGSLSTGCDDTPTWVTDFENSAPLTIAAITIQPDSVRLSVGEVIIFQVTAWDANGNELGSTASAQMISSNPRVLDVGRDGRWTAGRPGVALVTAYKWNHQAQAKVWVECIPR
jgi:hypothetical protein